MGLASLAQLVIEALLRTTFVVASKSSTCYYSKMGGGLSYQFYGDLSFYLPLSFMILGLVIIFPLHILLALYCHYKCSKVAVNTIISIEFQVLRLIYGSSLKGVASKTGDRIVITLYGRRLHPVYVGVLFSALVLIYICIIVAFFSELFVTESTGVCNIHMDCFALNSSTGLLVQQKALQSECIDIQNNSSYLIRCYRLSFNYMTALGNAGGVLVFGYFIMTYQTPFMEESINIGPSKYIYLIFIISNIIIIMIDVVILILVLGLVPEFNSSVFATRKTILQFTTYAVTFYFSLVATSAGMLGQWTSYEILSRRKEAKEGDDTNVGNRENIVPTAAV